MTLPRTPEQNRPYMKAYYQEHKEELLEKQSAYMKERLLGPDGDHVRNLRRLRVKLSRQRHPETWRRHNAESRARLRSEMFAAYGSDCACCGENRVEFLTLDHVNRDGAQHRRTLNKGRLRGANTRQVLFDLKRRGWPEGFRIMCMNCNWATRYGAGCPHAEMFSALAAGSACFAGDR